MDFEYRIVVVVMVLLWSGCHGNNPPAFGRIRPGFNFHHRPRTAESPYDIIHEHEAHQEVYNNGPHERPEFQHHHHPEVINPNPTVRLQAIVPATPQIRINPTPTSLNLTQDGRAHGEIGRAPTLPPIRNLSNPDHPEIVIPTDERNELNPRVAQAGHEVVPEIKSSSESPESFTAHLMQSSTSSGFRSISLDSVQSSLGMDLLPNSLRTSSLDSNILITSEILLDRLEATATSLMTPGVSSSVEANCGLLCLMTRNIEILAVSSAALKIQSTTLDQVATASISPTRTDIGSLPTDATGLVINNGRTSQRTTRITRQSSTTPLTLQTVKIQKTTQLRSESSTRSTTLPEILIPVTERATRSTTFKRLPMTVPNHSTTASTQRTDFPEILIPLTERTSTKPTFRITTAASTTPRSTTRIAGTSSTSLRPIQGETTTTRPRTQTISTTQMITTTQPVPTTKRSKYVPKGQRTFVFVSQTTVSPFTTSPSSPTISSQSSQRSMLQNGSRRTTQQSQTTQTTTVQMGFIGTTTKAPITVTQNIKSMTFPTFQPTNQTTIIKIDSNATTLSPQTLPDSGSRSRSTVAGSSVSSTESTTPLTSTVATTNITSEINTTSSVLTLIPTERMETNRPAYRVANVTTTPAIQIITRGPETIPPVFVTVRLRMSWNTFCINVRSFQHELVEILEENYQNSFKEEQIMIMNEEIKFCVEFQVVKNTDIFVKLYIVNFDGEYDSSLTVECAQFIESGFQDESFFKDKLVRVTLNTADENIQKHSPTSPPVLAPWTDPGITIAITIATLGGCCCIGVIILQILVRRRYRKTRIVTGITNRRRYSIASNDTIALASIKARPNSGVFNPALDILDMSRFINHNGILSNPVNFAGLVNICQDMELIYEEFYAIKNDMPRLSAVPKGAEDKNRYSNVIPYPKTRVNLKRKASQVNSEYINANFITGYPEENKAFIATQSPLPNTRDDFWRMIWEQQCRVIVMLNAMDEPGKSKCDDYWPDSPDNIIKHGDFTVVLKKKDVTQEYILSTLELKDIENNLIREIKHVWYTSWSYKNLPDPVSLVKFVIEIRRLYEDSGGPLVVHCSPGTGRTGTLLSVDICTRQYDTEKLVDVLKCVSKMRKERAGAVQTKEQYALVYQALYEYALFVNSPPISAASSVMTLHQVRL